MDSNTDRDSKSWNNRPAYRYLLIISKVTIFVIIFNLITGTKEFIDRFPYHINTGLLLGVVFGIAVFIQDRAPNSWKNSSLLGGFLFISVIIVAYIVSSFLEDPNKFINRFPYNINIGLLAGFALGVLLFIFALVERRKHK